jgi:hypothetical protein
MREMTMFEAEQVSGGLIRAAARFVFAVASMMYEFMSDAK